MTRVRITHVESFNVFAPGARPSFAWREGLRGGPADGLVAVLRLHTDEGVAGVAVTQNRASAVVLEDLVGRLLREELVGTDPLERERIWHRMWELDRTEEFPVWLIGLVDSALWDLAGRLYGLPTWELIGGFRREIPAYASTSTFASVGEYLEVVTQCIELGYPAIKLHAWGDARRDAALCAAVREHVGAGFPLMYDGSAAFDLADAVYVGDALSEAHYLWYEEPMREFNVTAYKWLADRVSVPLNVAETSDGVHMNTADFIASGCATFVRTSTELRGGFTGAMRIAHLADAFRLRAEPHGNTVYARHLCMAIPNCTYYESLVTTNPVQREFGIDENGMVKAPMAPGVGLPVGPEYPKALESYVVDPAGDPLSRDTSIRHSAAS
ncbi:MAG: enolase C-terminal domain-like protein [Acidimicrobiales bacterium]